MHNCKSKYQKQQLSTFLVIFPPVRVLVGNISSFRDFRKQVCYINSATVCILSPIQYFPHFPAGTQFSASYLKWMAAANKFSWFPLNSRHLKIPPPTQNKKLPTWSFFHGSNLDHFPPTHIQDQIIGSFHLIWNEIEMWMFHKTKPNSQILCQYYHFVFCESKHCFLSEILLPIQYSIPPLSQTLIKPSRVRLLFIFTTKYKIHF